MSAQPVLEPVADAPCEDVRLSLLGGFGLHVNGARVELPHSAQRLISFLVLQRTREVGIRMAVGATSTQIICLILSHAMRWTLAGVAVGLIGAAVAARSLRSLLFEVRAENPALFAIAALLMLVIGAAAALAPSLRAARVDPMTALRHE